MLEVLETIISALTKCIVIGVEILVILAIIIGVLFLFMTIWNSISVLIWGEGEDKDE